MRQGLINLFYLAVAILVSACAQQVAPTGGIKDEVPPEILDIQPPQEQLNYQNEKIVLDFNEFVKLNQLKKQFIASPPLKYNLLTKVKGKQIEIEIQDTLAPNTTYVLNFGEAIADFREGNPIEGFKYVFSTGNEIDTQKVSGRLINAFDLTVLKNAVVMLYDTTALDSLPYLQLPTYIDRTDEEGRFELTNIKPAVYSLFALKEDNSNYLFDKPDEAIAFLDSTLDLSLELDSINLYAFKEDKEKQYVASQNESGPLTILKFNRKLNEDTFAIDAIDTSLKDLLLHYEIGRKKDSLLLWFKELEDGEIKLDLAVNGGFRDTVKIKIDSLNVKERLKLIAKPSGRFDYFRSPKLIFNRPIAKLEDSLIRFFRRDTTELKIDPKIDSVRPQQVRLDLDLAQDSGYFLQFLPGAFEDIYGKTLNDTTTLRFTVNSEVDFGNMYVKISIEDTASFLLQLTDRKGNKLKQIALIDSEAQFLNLSAGEYGLKLIRDENKNGQWDTGSFNQRKQAERAYIYEGKITIRSNWDQEIEWQIE